MGSMIIDSRGGIAEEERRSLIYREMRNIRGWLNTDLVGLKALKTNTSVGGSPRLNTDYGRIESWSRSLFS